MGDNIARNLLGQLIMSPALISASDDLCDDLFTGRDKLVFQAISKLWNESQPESIALPVLVDRIGDKVPASYVSSLLDGITSAQPDGFTQLVRELAKVKLAKAIVKVVNDASQEIVKTGDIDLDVLSPLIERYKSVGDGGKRRSEDIRQWVFTTNGEFSLSKAYGELGARTPQEKTLIRVVISNLAKSGEVVPVGRNDGVYRLVDKRLEEVDLMGDIPEAMDLYLPLGLDHLVKIYPRSIIVCAGQSNKGKTGLAHDFIKHNMGKHEIHLFFSEGGVESLKDRLSKHPDKLVGEWRFKAYPRTSNFADVIFPDAINVIDYLLIPDEFWKVGSYLDEIYRKLNKGIAYVNIQKGGGAEIGRGGDFGLERPQLYFTLSQDLDVEFPADNMQYCVAKVIKAKAWKRRRNPDGLIQKFSIEDGWNIRHYNVWDYPPKKEKKDSAKPGWFKG
jgi:hypothetical protein